MTEIADEGYMKLIEIPGYVESGYIAFIQTVAM